MRYLAAVLIALIGTGQCAYADWLHRHGQDSGHYGADGWNLYGSVFLGAGLVVFVVSAVLDFWVTKRAVDVQERVGRRF